MLVPKSTEIQKRRNLLSMSCYQLSKKAGLPLNAITRIEKNTPRFTYPIRATAIANALGCDVKEIFEEVSQKGAKRND